MQDFIKEYIQWIFSGIGVAIIGWFFIKNKKDNDKENKKQIQKSGKESINIQVGNDFNINDRK